MAVSGLRLYGVMLLPDNDRARSPAPNTHVVRFREIGAVVRNAPYVAVEATDGERTAYQRVIEAVFDRGTIVPAPFGTVLRSADLVSRWLEMNYMGLAEGLHFVEGCCETRVHASASVALEGKEQPPADTSAQASECFRGLRRHAAAAVPLKQPVGAHTVMSGAFLIPRDTWNDFAAQVLEQAGRCPGMHFEQTGPWPPFDFVRMEFGA